MKRLLVVAALCVGLLVETGVAVAAGFVIFHQVRGDWAVLCWRDMVSQQKTCRLNAPPANMILGTRRNELIVHEYAADTFQVAIELHDPFDARYPLRTNLATKSGAEQHQVLSPDDVTGRLGEQGERLVDIAGRRFGFGQIPRKGRNHA